jgi:hypothetical protein
MPTNPDPRDEGPKPPFPDQKQSYPGHGEEAAR